MNLVERVKGILLQPKSEWGAIEGEPYRSHEAPDSAGQGSDLHDRSHRLRDHCVDRHFRHRRVVVRLVTPVRAKPSDDGSGGRA